MGTRSNAGERENPPKIRSPGTSPSGRIPSRRNRSPSSPSRESPSPSNRSPPSPPPSSDRTKGRSPKRRPCVLPCRGDSFVAPPPGRHRAVGHAAVLSQTAAAAGVQPPTDGQIVGGVACVWGRKKANVCVASCSFGSLMWISSSLGCSIDF